MVSCKISNYDPVLFRLLLISLEMTFYGICFSLNRYAKFLQRNKWKNAFSGSMFLLFVAWSWQCWELYYAFITKGVRA